MALFGLGCRRPPGRGRACRLGRLPPWRITAAVNARPRLRRVRMRARRGLSLCSVADAEHHAVELVRRAGSDLIAARTSPSAFVSFPPAWLPSGSIATKPTLPSLSASIFKASRDRGEPERAVDDRDEAGVAACWDQARGESRARGVPGGEEHASPRRSQLAARDARGDPESHVPPQTFGRRAGGRRRAVGAACRSRSDAADPARSRGERQPRQDVRRRIDVY